MEPVLDVDDLLAGRERSRAGTAHLRFFTRAGALALCGDSGYRVEPIEGIRAQPATGKLATLDRALRGRLRGLVYERDALVAVPS